MRLWPRLTYRQHAKIVCPGNELAESDQKLIKLS